jgi:RNA polymerase sigma-70 factor (ECF subfamily)
MLLAGSKSSEAAPSIELNTARDPDPAAPTLKTIYRDYFNFIWSSARHLGTTQDSIDDVVQDVFLVIHLKLPTLQRPASLRSWIYGIVRRTVSDYRRSRRTRDAARVKMGVELNLSLPAHPSPLEMAEHNANLALLDTILAELDETKREVFVMVEILQMTVPEAVQALEIPLNTAYSRLRLARQSFEESLAKHVARDEENTALCRP